MSIFGVSFSIVGIGLSVKPDLYVPSQDFWGLILVCGVILSVGFTYIFSLDSLGKAMNDES